MIGSTVWGKGRFEQTSMFGTQSGQVMKQRAQILAEEEGPNKILEVKSYHNKVILYSREFIKQYLTYYSPLYLFIAGGLPYRYSVSDQGLMYLIMIPMYLLLFYYFKDIERRTGILLLYMLFISPMPSPLTLDDVPNVHRTLFMIVPLTLLGSFALFKFLDTIKKPRFRYSMFAVILSVLLIEFIYFLHMYFNHANAVKSIERGDTNKELIN